MFIFWLNICLNLIDHFEQVKFFPEKRIIKLDLSQMKHYFFTKYSLTWLTFWFALFVMPCFAQVEEIKDPLKKPDLWAKLEVSPIDSALWTAYCGKEWKAMTKDDLEKVANWKQHLMLNIFAKNESLLGFVIKSKDAEDDFFIDDIAFKEIMSSLATTDGAPPTTSSPAVKKTKVNKAEMRKELAGIESVILSESKKLQELKKNVRANFSVIEDTYNTIFKEFNIQYVYYKTKYPDGNFPEMRWVENQEKKLQKLKQDQIAELRKKYSVK